MKSVPERCMWLIAIIGLVAAQATIDEKVHSLNEMVHRNPVLKLNMDRWKTYVRQQPRNYSMIVMFTALSPHVNCPICRPAHDEFMIVANSHRFTSSEADRRTVYFAMVDYEDSPQIFQQMNLNTAPLLYHFGPKLGGKKKPQQMDFQRQGFDADAISRFVADQTEVNIRVLRPPNYTAPVVIILLLGLVFGLLYMKRNSLDFIFNRSSWGIICLAITFIFMSGQMWNHIRGPPFVMTNPNTRETSFIHGSTQFQLVSETYIVAGLYAMITFGFIFINDAAEPATEKKKKGVGFAPNATTMAIIGLVMVCLFFSFLLSIFRSKYRGYPYSFLF